MTDDQAPDLEAAEMREPTHPEEPGDGTEVQCTHELTRAPDEPDHGTEVQRPDPTRRRRQGQDAYAQAGTLTKDEWLRRQAEHAIPAERLAPQGRPATRRSR